MAGLNLQRQRQRHGAASEAIVAHRLVALGMILVEKVEVGWRVHRAPGGKILGAHPAARVSGDFRATLPPNGRSVLVEVKHRNDALAWGMLEQHQHRSLEVHAGAGGLSLVAWVQSAVWIFDYRHAVAWGWGKGTPIGSTTAASLAALLVLHPPQGR